MEASDSSGSGANRIVELKGTATLGPLTVTAKARVRSNFSVPHLLAAARFSREVAKLERDNNDQPFGPFWEDILACSTACILCSVAAVEAYANEIFADDEIHFSHRDIELVKKLWEQWERKPVTDKYNLALFLLSKNEMKKNSEIVQNMTGLIALRNALTHFKPEWDDEQRIHESVSARLVGRFAPSPFLGAHEPLFPKSWATHGCTKWAIATCISFVEEFGRQAGIESKFRKFEHRLADH